jgi:Mrp family chromosome partitioning ATPase
MTVMPDDVLKPGIETKEDLPSLSPEDFVQPWERDDFCFPVETEVSPVSAESLAVVYLEPTSAGADRFRLAQIRLKGLQAARKLKTILVTSPLPGDGKTTVALNLATVLSENGKVPVLLLEADVYRPTLTKKLGLKAWPGLTEYFRRGEDPMLAIRRIDPLGFYLLPAGQPVGDGVSILQSPFASQLILSLSSSSFSWILIDSPPTTPVADVLTLSGQVDAVLLVARAGETPRESIEESVRTLGRDHIIGVILNGMEGLNRMYSKYYGYGKSYARVKPAKPRTLEGLGLNERTK